ncbi:MAG: hypothetical protein JJV98_12610, partial [Desulfosarcina sp.]|nr:hypothetical protein [Desulfobacterales bacterium]
MLFAVLMSIRSCQAGTRPIFIHNKASGKMTRLILILGLTVLLVSLVIAPSQAALQVFDNNNNFLWDDINRVYWLRNTNLAATSGFDSDGLMQANDTMHWINTDLNQLDGDGNAVGAGYLGFNDWRLPTLGEMTAMYDNY